MYCTNRDGNHQRPRQASLGFGPGGLDFDEAARVFMGEVATTQDLRHDYGEDRFITAGYLDDRMVVMVWTPRGEARHIISMRYCHEKERTLWLRRIGRSR